VRACVLALGACVLTGAAPPPAIGLRGMVAADHELASEAGAQVMAAGGNAADGAVAAALAAGVVQPAGSGLGGGGFAVIVTADGQQTVIDFRETAPQAATQDMYTLAEAADASRIGGLAVGVPGEAMGLAELHRRYGKLPWADVVAPAAKLATGGFSVGTHLAQALWEAEGAAPGLSLALFGQDIVPEQGATVRRITLGHTLKQLGLLGTPALTQGLLAEDLAQAVQSRGGILTQADLAGYSPRERTPVVGHYRGWTVVTMPPPSSGGVVLLQVLAALESGELPPANSAALMHRMAEAMKHAFSDRARYMGDPDRVDIPVGRLLSEERVAQIRADFDPKKTHPAAHYGTPMDAGQDGGTQHISALDEHGLAVSLTTTINTSFGSRVVAPASGILLNNEMDDFVARPGVPNHYGLVGSAANAVAPGARPLSSMSPTVLISPDGSERIVVGASGGPFIISSTLQVIINIVDFGLDPAEAVSAPRMHHQWAPDILFVDEGTSPDSIARLRALGHTVQIKSFYSSVQVIRGGAGGFLGASDPRKGGWPAGVGRAPLEPAPAP
jgi:gamma-glutamyltranspeptidase/glutathione hydrolase